MSFAHQTRVFPGILYSYFFVILLHAHIVVQTQTVGQFSLEIRSSHASASAPQTAACLALGSDDLQDPQPEGVCVHE